MGCRFVLEKYIGKSMQEKPVAADCTWNVGFQMHIQYVHDTIHNACTLFEMTCHTVTLYIYYTYEHVQLLK